MPKVQIEVTRLDAPNRFKLGWMGFHNDSLVVEDWTTASYDEVLMLYKALEVVLLGKADSRRTVLVEVADELETAA